MRKKKSPNAQVTSRNLPVSAFVQPSYENFIQTIKKELK